MKILYVENHAVFARQVTEQFLSKHEVTIVPSLSQARKILSEGTFDLALVDYDLDDGKGVEIIKEIRKKWPALGIIGVSSHEEGNQAMLKEGASAVCSKMNFDKIETIIERLKPMRGLPNV